MKEKIVLNVVGARPNFMKAAPMMRAMALRPELRPVLVNTGQHYDYNMSSVFFEELGLKFPDYNLEVGSGSHAVQTGGVMVRFEELCMKIKPDAVLVVGDVNSTMACTLVSSKLGIPVGHVEAGLRSRDRKMPEEINRLVTDVLSDWLFTPSQDADDNLLREGISRDKIFFSGNIMIDSLLYHLPQIKKSSITRSLDLLDRENTLPYGVVTLHRPGNVDSLEMMGKIIEAIAEIQKNIILVFPIHPRTKENLKRHGLFEKCQNMEHLKMIEPLGYIDFVALSRSSEFVLTDSGGIQEETTYFGIPCLTLRPNTERPVTVTQGTNELVKIENITEHIQNIQNGNWKRGTIPHLWDGATADRICDIIIKYLV